MFNTISIEPSNKQRDRFVNSFELHQDAYRQLCKTRYRMGLTKQDCDQVADSYCENNARAIIRETSDFEYQVSLVHGPKSFQLVAIQFAVKIGELFSVKLQVMSKSPKAYKIKGEFDLKKYVFPQNLRTGDATVSFENQMTTNFHPIELNTGSVFILKIGGAIKITSNINFIIEEFTGG